MTRNSVSGCVVDTSWDVDLVVMPTHGRSGVKRLLLGSVTERVVNTSPVPVLTVTPNADSEFYYPSRSVLVPTDGSQGAKLALDAGIDFAKASDAELHLLNVVETASLGIDVRSAVANDDLEKGADNILDTAREVANEASIEAISTTIEYGRPFREILSYIEEHDIDVVVLGTHGKTDFSRYALGGVSAKLIRTSPVPVLMARGPAPDNSDMAD
jgi:nucleotide-binding universal stress UspA family protein